MQNSREANSSNTGRMALITPCGRPCVVRSYSPSKQLATGGIDVSLFMIVKLSRKKPKTLASFILKLCKLLNILSCK